MDRHQLNMTAGKPMKLLLSFALPLMFGSIFQQLYTVVDVAIVGRGVGLDALAALGTVDWLNWMLFGIAQGFTQGFAIRVSQKYGEHDIAGLRDVLGQSARLSIWLAVIAILISQGGLHFFFRLLKVPSNLYGMAEQYTRILMAGMPVSVLYNYCASILRAIGDSKTPLKAMTVASVTNIVLDCIAVFVLNRGIAGAAVATVIAQCIASVICLAKMRATPELQFDRSHMVSDKQISGNLIALGAPITLKIAIIALGGMIIQSVVNRFDMAFIAGFTASNKLFGLLEIAAMSYGFAITTYVGQNFGAGLHNRITQGLKEGLVLSVLTSLLICAAMLMFGRDITMLFISSDSPELVAKAGDVAYLYLAAMSLSLPALYVLYVYQSALQGVGNTLATMISGCLEFCIRLIGSMIVTATGYANGIFAAEVAAWFGAATFLTISFYHHFRKIRNVK